ncbi:MAG: hypothetical protein ABSF00_02205 [Candidatus Bathyarchaeia archaeon]
MPEVANATGQPREGRTVVVLNAVNVVVYGVVPVSVVVVRLVAVPVYTVDEMRLVLVNVSVEVKEELDETDVLVDVIDVTEVDVAGVDVVVVKNVLVVVVLDEKVVVRGGVMRLNTPRVPVAGRVTQLESAKTETIIIVS